VTIGRPAMPESLNGRMAENYVQEHSQAAYECPSIRLEERPTFAANKPVSGNPEYL
jgi:hypothetical protein